MKKLILFAAAVAAIASCAKVETVNTTGPQKIEFKTLNSPMVKTGTSTDFTSNQTLGVNAYWINSSNKQSLYFQNSKFEYSASQSWTSTEYWPKTGSLAFLVYSPWTESNIDITFKSTSLGVTRELTRTLTNADEDFLYGEKITTRAVQKSPSNPAIPVVLKHAKAMLEVNVKLADSGVPATLYRIDKISFNRVSQTGTIKVTYFDNRKDSEEVTPSYKGDTAKELAQTYSETYVASEENTNLFSKYIFGDTVNTETDKLIVEYSILAGKEYRTMEPFEYVLKNASWEAAKKYIYNLTFTADQIIFNPSVENWGNGGKVDQTI